MNTDSSRRPPGRRDTRRPRPGGHAVPRNRRAEMLAAAPTVRQAIDGLRKRGSARQADAVETVLTYAEDAAARRERAAEREAKLPPPLSLYVFTDLRDRVNAQSPDASADVREGFEAFLAGQWEPNRPQRAPSGSTASKKSMSVAIPVDLVERVNAKAKQLVAEREWRTGRGYDLNARQVAIDWLKQKYPAPKPKATGAE